MNNEFTKQDMYDFARWYREYEENMEDNMD